MDVIRSEMGEERKLPPIREGKDLKEGDPRIIVGDKTASLPKEDELGTSEA